MMTPKSFSDLGLVRKYQRQDVNLDRLMSSMRRFLKWVDETHGDVSDAILTHDGEQWIVTIYVCQEGTNV